MGLHLWSELGCLFKLVVNKTSDIYRFDDVSRGCQGFFNTTSFIFEHELKNKKENRWRGTWTSRTVRITDRRTKDTRWAIDTDTVNSLKELDTLQLCWFFWSWENKQEVRWGAGELPVTKVAGWDDRMARRYRVRAVQITTPISHQTLPLSVI